MRSLIHGETGSGKTTFAKQGEVLESLILSDLKSGKTILIDDAERFPDKELTEIVKTCKGDIILTTSNIWKICKTVRDLCTKKSMGSKDFRKEAFLKKYPNSSPTFSFSDDMKDVLKIIYEEVDRHLVLEMLKELKPNMFMLVHWLSANGNIDIVQYIDENNLLKNKDIYIYPLIAFGISPRKRNLNFPKFAKKSIRLKDFRNRGVGK